MNLVLNEHLKLFATYQNDLAMAMFAIGGLAPSFALIYRTTTGTSPTFTALIAIGCLLGSLGLHYLGSVILKGLQP